MLNVSDIISELNLKNLFLWVIGGSSTPVNYIISLRKLLPKVFILNALGQTETLGGFLWFDLKKPEAIKLYFQKPESCGMPVEYISFKVI